jgi:hypothetical protein
MGFINKDTLTIDAILTNKGRDYLRKAVFGENQNGEHVITKWALGDDEIDYGLWDETVSDVTTFAKAFGQVIDNQPLTEPNVNWRTPTDSEIMRYLLLKNSIGESSEGNTDSSKSASTQTTSPPGKNDPGKNDGPLL